ncbi:MAG: hypothetical protein N2V75_07175 [Methanophagales archaeon]|nr:hypothetical protein [Methanophagales archaeon]
MRNKLMRFLGFEEAINQALPDHLFWVIGAEQKGEFTKNAAQLNEELAFGIPFKLEGFENEVLRGVSERGVITAMNIYEFPEERTKEYIALASLREQLRIAIKPGKSRSLICGEALREVIDSSISSIFGEVIDDLKKEEIRSGEADIQGIITRISEKLEGKLDKDGKVLLKGKISEFEEVLQGHYQKLVTETESIWKNGELDEDRIKTTTEWIDSEKGRIEKNLVGKSEVEELKNKAIAKYNELNKKRKGVFSWARGIDTLSEAVISLLSQFEENIRKRTEQKSKLAFLDKAERHLRDTQNRVTALKKRLTDFYQEEIAPPMDEFVKIPNLINLIDPSYQLPSLDFEEIKKQWMEAKQREIEEKMKESLRVDLLSIRLPNPHEGWETVEEHIRKPEVKIAIVPSFAQLEGEEHFNYLLKRSNCWKVVVYHFVFNVSMKEFLRAFEKKWQFLGKEE